MNSVSTHMELIKGFRVAYAALEVERDEALIAADRLAKALRRAAYVAEHLMQMIDQETWRASGGDDGQGHYEGDYHEGQLAMEIKRWIELASDPCPECGCPSDQYDGHICEEFRDNA